MLMSFALVVSCSGVIDEPEETADWRARRDRNRPDRETDIPFEPLSPLARRLTRDEYQNSLRDLVGVALSEDDLTIYPRERPLEGFIHIATSQSVNPEHVRAYHSLAATVVADPGFDDFLDAVAPCRETTASCGEQVAEAMATRLFRRPATEMETSAFATLFVSVAGEDTSFGDTARAVARAMLQSPQFLYLIEREDLAERVVSDYELASRLSYFLWASPPDAALLDAASRGALQTDEQIASHVDRMLANRARVRLVAERYLFDWARFEALPDEDGLNEQLIQSALAFYVDAVDSGENVLNLFGVEKVFLTPALAERYGFSPGGVGVREYPGNLARGRGGLLGQPGIIAGMTNADGGEIVARGLFLQSQLFCDHPPEPPAALQSEIDDFVAELPEGTSDRTIAEQRLERDECATCHGQFDPIAYAFENFDHRGGFRAEDEFGNDLRTDGWLPDSVTDSGRQLPYRDYAELMGLLGESARIRDCLTQRHVEFALGRTLAKEQGSAVIEIADAGRDAGGSFVALAKIIATHEVFRSVGGAR